MITNSNGVSQAAVEVVVEVGREEEIVEVEVYREVLVIQEDAGRVPAQGRGVNPIEDLKQNLYHRNAVVLGNILHHRLVRSHPLAPHRLHPEEIGIQEKHHHLLHQGREAYRKHGTDVGDQQLHRRHLHRHPLVPRT